MSPVQTVQVDTTTPGFAEVTGVYQNSSSEYQSSDRFELGGTVVVTDGKPTYRPASTR